MIKVGITGGIGSGKSVVSSLFEKYGIPIYIADERSKSLTSSSENIRNGLISLFGDDIYDENNQLNKTMLASFIFGNKQNLQKVNDIIHPEVAKDFQAWSAAQNSDICGIESAILFESGFDNLVDASILVYAPINLRIERAMMRDGASELQIRNRIQHQMSDEEKKERCGYIIYNDENHSLIPQVDNIIRHLKTLSPSYL